MEKKYCCTNPQCPDRETPFTMILNQESVMDEQNLAQMFCPRCKTPLENCREASGTAD